MLLRGAGSIRVPCAYARGPCCRSGTIFFKKKVYSVYLLYWYKYSRTVRTRPRAMLSIRRSFNKNKKCSQFTCFTGTNVQILTRRTYIRSTALLTCCSRRISKCSRPTSLRSLAWYSLYLRYWYTSTRFTGTKGAIRVAFQGAHLLHLAALAGMVLTLLVLLVQKYKY